MIVKCGIEMIGGTCSENCEECMEKLMNVKKNSIKEFKIEDTESEILKQINSAPQQIII